MAEILLSGKNPDRLVAIVDDEDLERVSALRWYAKRYKRSLTFYARAVVKGETIYLHRFVLGDACGDEIHHIDANGLNCSKANLLSVTHRENVIFAHARKAFDEQEEWL